jgi:hypothetical protein
MDKERSRSGGTIQRYRDTAAPKPVPSALPKYFDEIVDHLEPFLGSVGSVFHEIVSDQVHLDILSFPPTGNRSFWTFVTCGMSSEPMLVPEDIDDPSSCERAELVISLPAEWCGSGDPDQLEREGKWWPIKILKYAAHFPHLYKTWFWFGHTMAIEEKPEPLDDNTPFCAFFLAFPLGWPMESLKMIARDGRPISFLSVIPLYTDELQFKLDKGTDALLDLFDKARVNELLDPSRPSLVPAAPPKRVSRWSNLLSRKTPK